METSRKNMVVLKNLPSNLIEEAIVILKENKMTRKYQYAEEKKENKGQKNGIMRKENIVKSVNQKEKKTSQTVNKIEKDYIIREAEMIISNYISDLETKSPKWKNNIRKLEKKYKQSLKLNFVLGFVAILSLLISMI